MVFDEPSQLFVPFSAVNEEHSADTILSPAVVLAETFAEVLISDSVLLCLDSF